MTYQEETTTLAEKTSAQVLAALAAYVAGTLTLDAVAALIAAFIAAGNSGAAALGDLALAATVTLQTGTPAAPIGITRPDDEGERLDRAARTILADLHEHLSTDRLREPKQMLLSTRGAAADVDAEIEKAHNRFLRLAEAEIRQAAAEAFDAALKESEAVIGWTRGLEPEACQLCRWWWREGRVWAPEHPFQTHTGCDCSQIPVTRKESA